MMDIPSHYHLQFVILLGESIDFDLILAKYLHFTTFGDGSGHFQNLSLPNSGTEITKKLEKVQNNSPIITQYIRLESRSKI